ncbi:MAG: bifunctional 4-hydroxy-2-oxoglutarate aldolase/2-dehydro-3-deoxy-phosphogluconate aldolase [Nonomuraea sp.]|nr:bifunctional 4-hydroxy-2-oxoglutarate aldolase/2-dehydro-3-deoxy-phosphogluconate aldolase [Nonomuraea sp.]NUP61513.1 bifunctional 4-hydroxy-2-oxoglutarate aldolase/2-dehydro-3-deoxy-phosphogluconate aldolase [Nonomuraea sp.]NUP83312.1 bifunctional 4-hydroxy-2-oxoglutarate aldolase/2-dehydro-3-deoxy-phosphogluconate aldolase [Nonomuraea sp.]NUS03029.1 bifunctional 4-hydroxy-2-oxoglutarate aldolase/2-dehydro-3-deoxy-phosphogluconate aldolase [Nonomuraea sp.]NUT11764.1 bifunctional 4-hydroxy-2
MSLLDLAPVIPVVVIDDVATAVPMAKALVAGGLPVIEVTLRTRAALGAIERIAAEVPGATIGAGTIRGTADISAAVSAGARFLVSPGTTLSLVEALEASGVPYLPGAATVSEVMALVERGIKELKFFPAEAAGGVPYLKSLAGPLPDVRFCPTGGIKVETAADYLALPNVGCVGGSWLTPADALASGDWARVEKLAADAAALRP